MTRPTVEEVDFHLFKRALDRAIATGTRIVPREKERWASYVAAHGVREVNFQGFARSKYEGLEPVILDGTDELAGYYMWSAALERALRWRRGQKPGAAPPVP
jgi:hypothetical protein